MILCEYGCGNEGTERVTESIERILVKKAGRGTDSTLLI